MIRTPLPFATFVSSWFITKLDKAPKTGTRIAARPGLEALILIPATRRNANPSRRRNLLRCPNSFRSKPRCISGTRSFPIFAQNRSRMMHSRIFLQNTLYNPPLKASPTAFLRQSVAERFCFSKKPRNRGLGIFFILTHTLRIAIHMPKRYHPKFLLDELHGTPIAGVMRRLLTGGTRKIPQSL